ncbi:MAG: amidohydrolase family protein [Alphaproteobacteria bacterium]
MNGVVDADTHIAESAGIWEFIDQEMYPRRPVRVSVPEDTLYGASDVFWLIDGNIFPKPSGMGGFRLVTPSEATSQSSRGDITIASREITDPKIRLADMDRLGIQIQVIYPTLFLVYLTDDPALEVSLCRAYNKWLAQVWRADEERLRWVAVLPLRSIEASIEEMRVAKKNGATGVFFRGMEGDLTLDNPYFFPVYQEAEKLNLPICIHTGSGAPKLIDLYNLERNHSFAHGRVLPLFAFRDIVHNRIPEMFPKLRFGFVEASAGWAPFIVHILRRLLAKNWKFSSSQDLFHEYRMFIACEADEDIPYLADFIGDDKLIIGSDYGHNDPSAEPMLLESLASRGDLSVELQDSILKTNPRALYGI